MPRPPRTQSLLTLGAIPSRFGTAFRVHAPETKRVELLLETGAAAGTVVVMTPVGGGYFTHTLKHVRTGDHYRYRLDGGGPFPDPTSRYQPSGVHGPSEVVDPAAFSWTYREFRGASLETLIIYELHVGAFTPEGTFAGVVSKIPHLKRLGVTAIQLMPVHDFPGDRNWGYDPAALFAPARCYGTPDDMRRMVDAFHGAGMSVLLDVVYNHFGPDGAYVNAFNPHLFSPRKKTPWGRALNLDGKGSKPVREFLIENALHWIHEYRLDGLRLDATASMHDRSDEHFLGEVAARVHASVRGREIVMIAEDGRNHSRVLKPANKGGYGLDAEWSFDFHHQLHRILTGEKFGYYADFKKSLKDLARIVEQGWLYTGQPSRYWGGRKRGTSPRGIPSKRFIFYTQSHDEVGNRPGGERLSALVPFEVEKAITALLMLAPQTPMIFMGQEWGASTPFHFFTDHGARVGARVTEGRRKYLAEFFRLSRAAAAKIHDPQAVATFNASKLRWDETTAEPHAAMLRWYRALIELRRTEPALRAMSGGEHSCHLSSGRVTIKRSATRTSSIVIQVILGRTVRSQRSRPRLKSARKRGQRLALSSSDPAFLEYRSPTQISRRSQRWPARHPQGAGNCFVLLIDPRV